MASDQERLIELFDHCAALSGDARRAALDDIHAESPRLALELTSLLQAHDTVDDIPESLDPVRAAHLLEQDQLLSIPEHAGAFRLIREIGRGGIGVVYLGERDDGDFRQQVAVKLIKRGMDSDLILKRFHVERRILASLDHPNISRLIDGGMLDDGRPYFAMEHIQGTPINDWCDQRRLSLDARLRLFEQVCRAAQYAHARLIVHRDLKPANILVTDEGVIKLLDFGIAKLLDDTEADGSALTIAGMRAMTRRYAAPEQILGKPISVATDVYALGVVLYELLTGQHPYRISADTEEALMHKICDTSPTAPSVAVTREKAKNVASARASRPKALRRHLRGDLDTIVLTALAREPERRYGSAEALAEDISRYRKGLPIRARPESLIYRTGRFVSRHRIGVAVTAVMIGMLMAAVVLTAWQAERAGREARQAQAVQRFVVGVFEGADPTRSLGETVIARELLDEGARQLRSDYLDDGPVRAELADTLARTYLSLGLLDEAEVWASEAVTGFGNELGARHARTALAQLTYAEVAVERGAVVDARADLDHLVPRLQDAFGDDSPEHLRARTALSQVLRHSGEFERALEEGRFVLEAMRRQHGDDHTSTLVEAGRVASRLAVLSRYDEALALLNDVLERMELTGAANSPQGIWMKRELGALLETMGRREEALIALEEGLASGRNVLGENHPIVAQILIELGFIYGIEDRLDESESALTEAIVILEPWSHYDAGAAMRYLGFNYQRTERWTEAVAIFSQAENFIRNKLGDDNYLTWAAVVSRAYAQARQGQIEEGKAALIEAVSALEQLHGSESNDVRVPKKYLGEVLRMAGRHAEAEQLHRWALALEIQLFGGDNTLASAATKVQIALDLLESGQPERLAEARQLVDEAHASVLDVGAADTWRANVLATSGRIAAAEGDAERARRELSEAIELYLPLRGEDAPSVVEARSYLQAL